MKKDLSDDGFRDELEEMKVNSRDAMGLLGDAQVRKPGRTCSPSDSRLRKKCR